MKYSFVAAALAAPVVLAIPAKRQSTNIDTTVLQFALTLEHLENVFYKQALQKFSQDDFKKAGYGANYYNNLRTITYDEQSHVQFLSQALSAAGVTPNAACTYSFPYTDVNSFITLSSIIEGVGTSAYLGGAPLITSKDYLTAAGSILVTEALHTSLQRNVINEVPFASPYGTPLDPTSVYTIAAAFIKSCPSSNAALPFTPYPSLALNTTAGTCEEPDCSPRAIAKRDGWETYSAPATETPKHETPKTETVTYTITKTVSGSYPTGTGWAGYNNGQPGYDSGKPDGGKPDVGKPNDWESYGSKPDVGKSGEWQGYGGKDDAPPSSSKNQVALKAGQTAVFTAASAIPAGSFLTFVVGLTVTSVPANINGNSASVAIPDAATGQTYVFVTKTAAANNKLDGSSVLFGPAILEVTPATPVIDFSQSKH